MALSPTYKVIRIAGLKNSDRRGIVFLSSERDATLDAHDVFENLDEIPKRLLLSRFDYWIDGGINDRYFHGWSDPNYRNCFVFKWKHENQNHRMYGFLCHSKPNENPRFQLCVLISHARKTQWETDPQELNGARNLHESAAVREAIARAFPAKPIRTRGTP